MLKIGTGRLIPALSALLILFQVCLATLLPSPALGLGTVVNFPDAHLEAVIRDAIGKPSGDIYDSDLVGLTDLDASFEDITNITGLEYCSGLTSLNLSGNSISDLAPLAGLTGLNHLSLGYNRISNLAPLAGLTNLTSLWLASNDISNLAPLAGLTALTRLGLTDNHISNLAPLAGLTALDDLELGNNTISDLRPLAGLTGLTTIWLYNNEISDLKPLAGLTSLKSLFLWSNRISDLRPLAGLINLYWLELGENQIVSVAPLSGLTGLTQLDLYDNQISNIAPLAGLVNINRLSLHANRISDISPLLDNTGLGTGDSVSLFSNPLSPASLDVYIPALQTRGVNVRIGIVIITESAGEIRGTSALLSGRLFTPYKLNGGAVSFRWGTSPGVYTDITTPVPVDSSEEFSQRLPRLRPGTTYYYVAQVTAEEPAVNSQGEEMSFTTLAAKRGTASGQASLPPAMQAPVSLPDIQVHSASLSAGRVSPGTPVTVTASVVNRGTVNASTALKIFVNGEEEASHGINLGSGDSRVITFSVSRSAPGTYAVYVGSVQAGSFLVEDASGSDILLYLSLFLICLAAVLAIIMLNRRNRWSQRSESN